MTRGQAKAHLQSLDFFNCSLLALQLQLQSTNLLLLGLHSHFISAERLGRLGFGPTGLIDDTPTALITVLQGVLLEVMLLLHMPT